MARMIEIEEDKWLKLIGEIASIQEKNENLKAENVKRANEIGKIKQQLKPVDWEDLIPEFNYDCYDDWLTNTFEAGSDYHPQTTETEELYWNIDKLKCMFNDAEQENIKIKKEITELKKQAYYKDCVRMVMEGVYQDVQEADAWGEFIDCEFDDDKTKKFLIDWFQIEWNDDDVWAWV